MSAIRCLAMRSSSTFNRNSTAGLTAPVRQFILGVATDPVVGAQNDTLDLLDSTVLRLGLFRPIGPRWLVLVRPVFLSVCWTPTCRCVSTGRAGLPGRLQACASGYEALPEDETAVVDSDDFTDRELSRDAPKSNHCRLPRNTVGKSDFQVKIDELTLATGLAHPKTTPLVYKQEGLASRPVPCGHRAVSKMRNLKPDVDFESSHAVPEKNEGTDP